MTIFQAPPQQVPEKYLIDRFLGVDLTNDPANVSIFRSPEAPNMIRGDGVGKVRKRDGLKTVKSLFTPSSRTYTITSGGVGEVKGKKRFNLNNFQTYAGDRFSFDGVIIDIVPVGPQALGPYQAFPGSDMTSSRDNFFYTLQNRCPAITEKYNVSMPTSTTIELTEKAPLGVAVPEFQVLLKTYATLGISVSASYTVASVVGDTLTIAGQTFTLGREIVASANMTTQTTYILNRLKATEYFAGRFTMTAAANVITFVSKVPLPGYDPPDMATTGTAKITNGVLTPTVAAPINGYHILHGVPDKKLIHAGTKIYLDGDTPTQLYSGANDGFSVSIEFNSKLWIWDGLAYLVFDGTTVKKVTDTFTAANAPVIMIGRLEAGGGTLLDPINLLNPYMTVKFQTPTATGAKTLQLPHTSIDSVEKVERLNANGTTTVLTLGTPGSSYPNEYSRNLTTGVVTVYNQLTADGLDHFYITYKKTIVGYADKINKCDISTIYGMNGNRDRVFVSGNPSFPNQDWNSQINDPSYFPDINYSVLGNSGSKIMNYSIINDYLVAHKDKGENGSNAILRAGQLENGKMIFPIKMTYQTAGALAKHSFTAVANETLYLTTDKNVSAIVPSDVFGERFSQERSFFISKAIAQAANLESAYSVEHDGFYYLALDGNIYVLDSRQYSIEENRPYNTRQFEAYFFPGIAARVLWVDNNKLYVGDSGGRIREFSIENPNDDGIAFDAYWDTPELEGTNFINKKKFSYIGAKVSSALSTGVQISARVRGVWGWKVFMNYSADANYMDWESINFDNFTFSTDMTPRTVGKKINKIKGVDKVQFRIQNDRMEDLFGLYRVEIEYTEGGKFVK